jgi:hypothetical protein
MTGRDYWRRLKAWWYAEPDHVFELTHEEFARVERIAAAFGVSRSDALKIIIRSYVTMRDARKSSKPGRAER